MRVLFVDDQPNVLDGLRRMLRGLRHEWQMEFANSGDEALSLMSRQAFDVVVSDMRMPGMDGSELLTTIMARYPETVRIILSGEADQASVMRAVTPAHQYLSKPCDAETLKNTVARACSLRDTLRQESLVQLVSQVTTLPSLPLTYSKLLEELQSEDASIQDVAELIAQDVGMTAKLMHMVNSSFFGIPRRVESPIHAAALLGLNVLKPLVLSAGIFSQFPVDKSLGYSVESLMEHSLAVSQLANEIVNCHCEDKELAEDALMAGLLHDVGKLLLVANLPDKYAQVLRHARDNETTLCDAEVEYLGASHADVGAYLLGLWGLADSIVEAVAFHHRPTNGPCDRFSPVTAVHVANILIHELNSDDSSTVIPEIDIEYLEKVGVAGQLANWRELAVQFDAVGV